MAEGVRQQPADNVVAVLSSVLSAVLQALGDHHDRLTEVLKDCLDEFRKRMFAESLISRALKDTTSLVKIMEHFKANFGYCDDIQSLKDMCLSFLVVLRSMSEAIKKTADSLQDAWNKGINKAWPSLGGTTFLVFPAKAHVSLDELNYVCSIQSPSMKRVNSDGVIKRPPPLSQKSCPNLSELSCQSFNEIGPLSTGAAQIHDDLSDSNSLSTDSDDGLRKESSRKTRHHSNKPIPVSDRDDMPVSETRPGQVDVAKLSRFNSTVSAGQSDSSSTINVQNREFDRAFSLDQVLEDEKRDNRNNQKRLRDRYKLEIKNLRDELSKTRLEQDEISKKRNEDLDELKRLFKEKKERFKSKKSSFYSEQVQFEKDIDQFKRDRAELQVESRELEETRRYLKTIKFRWFIFFYGLTLLLLFATFMLYVGYTSKRRIITDL